MTILEVRGLSKRYGGLAALDGLDLDVQEGEIRGVIGPNGAGKTTLFNVISGSEKPTAGRISYQDENIANLHASAIAQKGLVRTFQRPAVFGKFTVLENVLIAQHLHFNETPVDVLFRPARSRELSGEKKAREVLKFTNLEGLKDEVSMNLAHGHQKSIGVAIALATGPKLVMLDEPVAGMNESEARRMTELIRRIRNELGITVLLVEHDMRTVMGACDRITVLNFGQKLAEGLPKEIRENPAVIEAYLGVHDDAA